MILVSKDINLRVKARGLGLEAEDYESVRVDDPDRLYSRASIEMDVAKEICRPPAQRGGIRCRLEVCRRGAAANQYFILRSGSSSVLARHNARTGHIEKLPPACAPTVSRPRNAEQTFTLHAILDPEVPLVTVTGPAGTGKTLLALAGALEQRPQLPSDLPDASDRAAEQPRHRLPAGRHRLQDQPVHAAAVGQPEFHQESTSRPRRPSTGISRAWWRATSSTSCRWPIYAAAAVQHHLHRRRGAESDPA